MGMIEQVVFKREAQKTMKVTVESILETMVELLNVCCTSAISYAEHLLIVALGWTGKQNNI